MTWQLGERGSVALGAMAAALLGIVTFAPALKHEFVYDDLPNIVDNRWIRDPRFLPEIFRSHAAGFDPKFRTSYYRPMTHVAAMASYHLFGPRPWGFHLFQVLLHAATSVLACLTVRGLGKRDPSLPEGGAFVAVVAGLLFATHPAHAEAVAWLAGVTDVGFAFFALAAFLCHLGAERKGAIASAASAFFFLAAALCKEPALMLLPLILLYELSFRSPERSPRRPGAAVRLLPLAAALVPYLVLRVRALGGFAPVEVHLSQEGLASIQSGFSLFAGYLGRLILPVNLGALTAFRPVESLLDLRAIAGAVLAAGLGVAGWRLRRFPLVVIGLAVVVLPLVPALYLPWLGEVVFAERYLYLSVLGWAILLACGAQAAITRWPKGKGVVGAAIAVVVVAYAGGSAARSRVWRSNLSLWTDAVARSPESALAHEHLCFAQYQAGRPRDALESCRRALDLDPGRIDARVNLATALSVLGDLDGAVAEFQRVLRYRPGSAEAHTNLGLVYMAKNRPDLAIESYRSALRSNPHHAEAHNDLGVALALAGRREEAVAELKEAVRLAPDNREYASNLERLSGSSGSSGPNRP